jgi:hypothetical protein
MLASAYPASANWLDVWGIFYIPYPAWEIDVEGAGLCTAQSAISTNPVADGVGIDTWGGSGNSVGSYFYNDAQTATNCT